jgi:arsenate reductase
MTRPTAQVIHGLPNCDACRAARKALPDATFRDLRADPPGMEEVARWRDAVGDALLNTRSTTWRGLDAATRAGDPVAAMVAHPTLVKRPVIEAGDTVLIGWTPATRTALGL